MSPLFKCPDCGHLITKHDEAGCTLGSCKCDGTSGVW